MSNIELSNEKEVNQILASNGIQPMQSNVERFHDWYCNILKGKYQADNVRMARAFHIVANHQIKTLIN